MATNKVNIGTGAVSGMFYHAAISSTLKMPDSPFDDLANDFSDFSEVGYVGEDGPSWTPYGSTEVIRAWSLEAVRNIKTEKGTVSVPVLSTTGESLKTVFGSGAVTETEATTDRGNLVTVETVDGPYNENEAFVLIGVDGTDGIMLKCASGMVTEISEIGFTPTGAIIWQISIEGDWTFVKDDNQKEEASN